MSGSNSGAGPLRGRPARAAGSKPIGDCGQITFSKALPATVQTAAISGFWVPQIRAILGLMRFNFLSVLLFWRKSAIRLFARKHEATTVKIFVNRSFYSLVIVTGLMAIFVAGCGGEEGTNTINLTLPSISAPAPVLTSAPVPAPTSYTIAIPE